MCRNADHSLDPLDRRPKR